MRDWGSPADGGRQRPGDLLQLSVLWPSAGTCVVTVYGEVDLFTVPVLEAGLREQLDTAPAHLILNLERVEFLAASGLRCMLDTRERARREARTALYLSGLANPVVARPLTVTALCDQFDAYLTLSDALRAVTDAAEGDQLAAVN